MDKPSLLLVETSESQARSGGNRKGDLGLLTLSQPLASTPVAADIIFIHGLGGGSRKTWSYSSDPDHFWPQSWLSKDPDFANVRIHTFGYAADWADSQRSVLGISDFAHSLLGEISNHRDIRRATNGIILCGHSLGGCVAKKAYIIARQDPSRTGLASRIRSIIFLGTPHRGSNLAGILNKVLSATVTKKPFVPSLKRGSSELVDINDAFRNIQTPLRLWSFYETLPTKTFAFFRSIVVEKDSATLGYPGEEIAALAADHRQMCKFRSPDDPNYRTIRNAMLTAVDAIRSAQPGLNLVETKRQKADNGARLRRFLQIQSMPEDDFEALRVLKQPGSCEWLTHREGFSTWLLGGEDVPNIFWLTATPGAGKSVLSVHVLDTVGESDPVICSGFSFQGSKSRNSAISECLRSLAYQMARADAEVMNKVLHLEEEGLTWNPLDESAVWRNLFVGNIFDVPSISRHIWVIDGLDECVDFQAIFTKKLLLNVSPKLRIFMTSRPLEAIDRGMRTLGPRVSRYKLKKDDTVDDMTRVARTKLRELGIPEDEEDRLCRAILGRSSGMFLWVWLVLRGFESDTIWTAEGMYSALNEIPSDLTDLYTKNLGPVLKDKRALKLARPILAWVMLGSRMLTTQEIRCAVGLEIQEMLQRIERAIPTICAQLLSVDKSNRVHIIHETFREFLLSEESPPALDIRKVQSNSRIATLLLRYLAGDHMQPVIREDSTFILKGIESHADMALVDYAARYFSDHLSGSDAADDELLDSLVCFLESDKVLSWIALAAKDGDMLRLSKVATHLQKYVDRRLETLGPNVVDPRCNLVRQWETDLFRFSCQFGPQLVISPGSIFDQIPSLCPSHTAIATSFLRFLPSCPSRVLGSIWSNNWDPILTIAELDPWRATAIAYGQNLFAVVMRMISTNGTHVENIRVYDHNSTQCILDIPLFHQPGFKTGSLCLSPDDQYLAVHRKDHVLIFEPHIGTLVHTRKLEEHCSCINMTFATAERLVLATSKGITVIEWEDHPSNRDYIRRIILPARQSPHHDVVISPVGMAAERDRLIVAFTSSNGDTPMPMVVWDATKAEMIREYSYEDMMIDDAHPTREIVAPASGKLHPRTVWVAWINPNLALPVLALTWSTPADNSYDLRLSITNYSSGARLDESTLVDSFIASWGQSDASFSADGRTLVLLYGYEFHIRFFSTSTDGAIQVSARTLSVWSNHSSSSASIPFISPIRPSIDGSRLVISSGCELYVLALEPEAGETTKLAEIPYPARDVVEEETKSTRPRVCRVSAGNDGYYLTADRDKIVLISTRALSTPVLWGEKAAAFQPVTTIINGRHMTNSNRIHTAPNNEGSRAVWEYTNTDSDETEHHVVVVVDLTAPMAEWDVATHENSGPACNTILEQVVHSPSNWVLLNESGDRFLRGFVDRFELWELPSGRQLATRTFRECWGRGVRDIDASPGTDTSLQPLLTHHPTDPEWLVCVDVRMHEPVILVSWRDLELRTCLDKRKLEDKPDEEAGEPHQVDQPTTPGLFAFLLRGLETVTRNVYHDSLWFLWRDWFNQHTALCGTIDACTIPIVEAIWDTDITPIAFFASTRTLIFRGRDSWVYSTNMLQHFPHTDNGEPHIPLSQSPMTHRGRGSKSGEGLPCQECGRHHHVRARRHFFSSFLSIGRSEHCFCADGLVTPDGRQTFDFLIWGHSVMSSVIVKDGLRYGEDVELVERRDDEGNVLTREWKRVEEESWSVNPRMEGSA